MYICDRCLKEADDVYGLVAWPRKADHAPKKITDALSEKYLCAACIKGLFRRKSNGKKGKLSVDLTTVMYGRPKVQNIFRENEAKIIEMYRSGMELEEISDKLGIYMAPISHLIDDLGLGQERYGDDYVPSDGAAQIPFVNRTELRGGKRR